MPAHSIRIDEQATVAERRLVEKLLFAFCVYLVPIAVGIVLIAGFLTWPRQSAGIDDRILEFRVIEDVSASLGPRQALEKLSAMPIESGHDTKLSEAPFWFAFPVPHVARDAPIEIEFPSRHARELTCWDPATFDSLGFANRVGSAGQMRQVKSGFAIKLGTPTVIARLLCRGTFSGPARILINEWPESQLELSLQRFSFEAGMLEGAMTLLVAYMLVLAVLNRDVIFLVCAMWIVATCRMAALTSGQDHEWLSHVLSPAIVYSMRPFTSTSLYIASFALLDQFIRSDLQSSLQSWFLRIAHWLGIALLIAATFLSYREYSPLLWIAASYGVFVQMAILAKSLLNRAPMPIVLFSGAIGISLVSFFYNIVAATLGLQGALRELNVPVAALLSCLLMALAIAGKARSESPEESTDRKAGLANAYEKVPTALFAVNLSGQITHGNPAFTHLTGVSTDRATRIAWDDCFSGLSWNDVQADIQRSGRIQCDLRTKRAKKNDEDRLLVTLVHVADRIDGSLQSSAKYSKTADLRGAVVGLRN